MNLRGRNLSIEMSGEDVALLQRELAKLGYTIDPAEVAAKRFGPTTRDAVVLFQRRHHQDVTGVVDEQTARPINAEVDALRPIATAAVPTVPLSPVAPSASRAPAPPAGDQPYVVRGQVRQADGSVLADVLVRAVDKDLRHEQLLGETRTNTEGNYEIRYTAAQFSRAEVGTADLIVRVYSADGTVLVASPVLFNAPPVATINLVVGGEVYRGPSEYERFVAAMTPALDGVALIDLTDDDVTFLTGETGVKEQYIHFLVVAQHLARDSGLPPEVFYGFAREDLPTELTPLLAVHANVQRRALERALSDNIIPVRFASQVGALLERLRQLMISQSLVYPTAPGAFARGALLATAGLSRQLIERLHTLYTEHVGSIAEFWAALKKDPDFSQNGRVETLQFTMQISSIARGHVPLVQALQQMRQAGTIMSTRDLARVTENDWRTLIMGRDKRPGVGFPLDASGKDDAERAANYARTVAGAVESLFPAAVVAARVTQARRSGTEDLAHFFDTNSDFDLGATHIETYLATNRHTALVGISNPTQLVQQLKSTQRIFKVTPHYDEMQVLMAAGFDSALSIMRMGQTTFVAAQAKQLGGDRAQQIYAQADRVTSMALAVVTQYSPAFNPVQVAGLPGIGRDYLTGGGNGGNGGGAGGGGGPTLETLFGSQAFCACDECRSILSPAAYLADILHFVSQHSMDLNSQPDPTMIADRALFHRLRRPDLGGIQLSCVNTNTELPYIDLVNEVLEHAVAQDAGLPDMAPPQYKYPQTTWTSDELRANPEHTIDAAYTDVLTKAIYGWSLPFDLAAEEARVYLEHLGVPRAELMQAFQHRGGAAPGPSDDDIAREYLRLTSLEQQIITDARISINNVLVQPWQFWFKTSPTNWVSELQNIPAFLRQSGLTYQELLDLLGTAFIQPNDPKFRLQIAFADTTCSLDTATIVIVTAADGKSIDSTTFDTMFPVALGRIHRFTRLRRKLGWTASDLDKAIAALKPGDLTDAFLTQLAHIQRFRAELQVPLVNLLSWWSPIDTAPGADGAASLYDQLFRNKALLRLEQGDPFNLINGQPQAKSDPLSKHAPSILAALNISASDLALVADGSMQVTLENLSYLYRLTSVARALKVPIAEFVSLIALTPKINAFYKDNLEDTRRFIDSARKVKASGFSIAELDYLLRHVIRPGDGIAPSDESIAVTLTALQTGLQKIAVDTALVPDATGDLTRKKLATVLPADQLDMAMAVIAGTVTQSDSEAFIDANFGSFLADLNDAKMQLGPISLITQASPPPLTTLADRLHYVLVPLMAYLCKVASESFVKQKLGESLKLNAPTITVLLTAAITSSRVSPDPKAVRGRMALAEFLDPIFWDSLEPVRVATTGPTTGALATLSGTPRIDGVALVKGDRVLVKDQAYAPDNGIYVVSDKTWIRAEDGDIASTAHAGMSVLVREGSLNHNTLWVLTSRSMTSSLEFIKELGGPMVPAATYTKLYKAAMVVRKLKITATELGTTLTDLGFSASETRSWFVLRGPALGWLDLNTLPLTDPSVSEPGAAGPLFAAWQRLVEVFMLRHALPRGKPDVFALLEAAHAIAMGNPQAGTIQNLQDYLTALSARTGWNLSDLQELAGANGVLGLVFPNDFQDERALVRLKACLGLLKRLGVAAGQISAWITSEVTLDAARDMRKTVKAKYQDAEWLAVAQPLQDALREKQRAALASYMVTRFKQRDFEDSNALFEWYLIDSEMGSCQLTTRIKQAISSVQLYIQRSAMNLEPRLALGTDDAKVWATWMKSYRVWEANRQVFLYPENWIEPGMLDVKTPCFKQLESRLLQGEVTAESAEDALMAYLGQLDEVANLDIAGVYHEQEQDADGNVDVDIQHVFGRTAGGAPVYYYRRLVISLNPPSERWTPWEKVDVDIQGNHLMPIVWNRRLHLFWPIFTQKQNPASDADKKNNTNPSQYLEIQIAWSEYKHGKWTAKKISPKSDRLTAGNDSDARRRLVQEYDHILDQSRYVFRAQVWGDGVIIRCFYTEWFDQLMQVGYDPKAQPLLGLLSEGYSLALALLTMYPAAMSLVSVDNSNNTATLLEYRNLGLLEGTFTFSSCGGAPTITPFAQVGSTSDPFFVPLNTGADYNSFKETKGDDTGDDSLYLFQESGYQYPVLTSTPGTFRVVYPHTLLMSVSHDAFFFEDDQQVFYVVPRPLSAKDQQWNRPTHGYEFHIFYHPYICEAIRRLNRDGVDGLMRWPTEQVKGGQAVPLLRDGIFHNTYHPQDLVRWWQDEDLDFDDSGAYAQYNWELFFHVPLLIASRLSKNQRFDEAQKWFHYIFDPTSRAQYPPPTKQAARFWKMRKFFDDAAAGLPPTITAMLQALATDDQLQSEVDAWRLDPFNPHLIARMRTKGWTYQKTVVMKYIDNLIAWGDQLFRQDTIEAINEATQLYILAADILGPRPQRIPQAVTVSDDLTYNQLATQKQPLDALSNVLIDTENLGNVPQNSGQTPAVPLQVVLSGLQALFFCIPPNDKLLRYWDTVADRLFKIRHCMNIAGVVRQLPIFEPPIDPALLVQAAAAGVDLSSVLNDLSAPLSHYRFTFMLQKANELCADVRALGAELLSALEKQDAEHLALLRSGHELAILKAVRDVKVSQITEAQATLNGLNQYQGVVTARQDYYLTLKLNGRIAEEDEQENLLYSAIAFQTAQAAMEYIAGILHLIPSVKLAAPTSAGTSYGGPNVAASLQAFESALGATASTLSTGASTAGIEASYKRRDVEWAHQADLATKELLQVAQQIAAATIRVAIAEKELDNHDAQIDNANEVDSYYHDKFTNEDLYDWMVGQISAVYFQSYQMAYDLAKRVEQGFRFELGDDTATFINFGYWDSLKKGLLAGEQLQQDLRRMEIAYLDQNKREYEITKHISLASLDPVALVTLRETGSCFVTLPEPLYDADYPGHYLRRIKSVSLTLPCVTGPYTSINCTLTLLWNSSRQKAQATDKNNYPRNVKGTDSRFKDNVGAIQAIATSTGQNDSGSFELSFRDERYLPFEGAGAISDWRIELPKETNAWDVETLSDVVIHVRYTARDGGEELKAAAWTATFGSDKPDVTARTEPPAAGDSTSAVLFSAKHAFASEWQRFLHPADTATSHAMQLVLSKERFPFQFRNQTITVKKVDLFLKFTDSAFGDGNAYRNAQLIVHLTQAAAPWPPTGSGGIGPTLSSDQFLFGGVPHASADFSVVAVDDIDSTANCWTLEAREDIVPGNGQQPQANIGAMDPAFWESVTDTNGSVHARLKAAAIEDLLIVVHFTHTAS